MKRKQVKWLIISVGFSVIVLGLVLFFTIDEQTIEYIRRINPLFLIAAVLFHFVALLCWSLRIQLMTAALGYRVSLLHCVNLVFANMLVAAITPSQAGGEPVRVHELYRAHVRIGDATAVVIMERVMDGIVLGLIGILAMIYLGSHWNSIGLNLGYLMLASWLMVTIFVLIFAYSVRNPDFLKRVLKKISFWINRRWHSQRIDRFIEAIDHEVDNFHGSLQHFVGRARLGVVAGLVFTLLFWFFEFIIASFILMGLGQPPFFVESFVIQLIIAILMMIPLTPGGSGIAEISATSLYGLIVSSSIVGVFVVLWRVILYYLNILIGVFSSVVIVRRELVLRKIGLR